MTEGIYFVSVSTVFRFAFGAVLVVLVVWLVFGMFWFSLYYIPQFNFFVKNKLQEITGKIRTLNV